jgi:hypothetical protein
MKRQDTQGFVAAAKPAPRQSASGDIAVAELKPGVLGLNEIRPDRPDDLGMLRGHFEPDHGVVAVHGVVAYDSRGRIVPDSDGHGFLLYGFLWIGKMLLTAEQAMTCITDRLARESGSTQKSWMRLIKPFRLLSE